MTAKIENIIIFNASAGQFVYIANINFFHNSNVAAHRIEHSAWGIVPSNLRFALCALPYAFYHLTNSHFNPAAKPNRLLKFVFQLCHL